jgi:4-amino-4-deoxy-L-arabinose transferase-like glycosyltransferase
MRRSLLVLLCLVLAGAAVTYTNRRLPLVRNSLVYARVSEHVIAHGYDPRPVVADSRLSYDKPILYAWLSAPFVRAFGNHDGLRWTSFLTTAAYLLALLHFARSFRDLLPARGGAWVPWLGALGPCVFYQFWSAHPDGWFAAVAVLAWSLTHRIVAREGRDPVPLVLALGATLLVGILLKNYGLVLLGSSPLYIAWHWRALRRDRARSRRLLVSGALVVAALTVFVALAATGHNPLSRLEGQGGGVGQYGAGDLWISARGTVVALALALLLQFQVALAWLARRGAWGRPLLPVLLCFGGPYVLGLMPFPTSFYNMRYFVPLFALGALLLTRGAATWPANARRAVLAAHGVLATLLIAIFNLPGPYRAAQPHLPDLTVGWIGVPLSLLDNLRMEQHLEQAALLDHIDAKLPPGSTLYLLDADYYGDAQHGVFERAGLIRGDIATRYASARGFAPAEEHFYAWPARRMPAGIGLVEDLGLGLASVVRAAPGEGR